MIFSLIPNCETVDPYYIDPSFGWGDTSLVVTRVLWNKVLSYLQN